MKIRPEPPPSAAPPATAAALEAALGRLEAAARRPRAAVEVPLQALLEPLEAGFLGLDAAQLGRLYRLIGRLSGGAAPPQAWRGLLKVVANGEVQLLVLLRHDIAAGSVHAAAARGRARVMARHGSSGTSRAQAQGLGGGPALLGAGGRVAALTARLRPAATAAQPAPPGPKRKDARAPLDALSAAQRSAFWARLRQAPSTVYAAAFAALVLVPDKPRHLTLMQVIGRRHRYAMTNTQYRGSAGKVRRGRRDDGLPVALKELHSGPPEGAAAARPRALRRTDGSRPNDAGTVATTPAAMRHEVEVMRRAGARCQPLEVIELPAGKQLMVLPAMLGPLTPLTLVPAEGRHMLREVCGDLGALHRSGLAHCDIKRDNILYDAEGRFVAFDYGLATPLGEAATGSLHTMAPELLRGRVGCSSRSDAFSLAMAWAEAVAGRSSPLDSSSFDAALRRHLSFAAWHAALPRRADGEVDTEALAACADSDRFGDARDDFDDFFGPLCERDPAVAGHVIGHMVVPEVDARADVAATEGFLAGLPDAEGDAAAAAGRARLRGSRAVRLAAIDAVLDAYLWALAQA